MAMSRVIIENEENLRDALNNGISGEAVEKTINSMISSSDSYPITPEQVKESIEIIVDMKKNVPSKENLNYASELVKKNSEKIKSALNDGISPEEIATNLINENDKKKVRFATKLVSKIKQLELRLRKEKKQSKARQFVKK